MPQTTKSQTLRPRLHRPSIFVRIRPELEYAETHLQEAVEKKLSGWTSDSIQVEDRHDTTHYTFPQQVFPPDATQSFVYESTLLPLMEEYLSGSQNVVFFAYGQTGSGKTHTIFGPRDSLQECENRHEESHPLWGLIPRSIHHLFQVMNQKSSVCYTLEAQAIEFYMFTCHDLLNRRKEVQLNENLEPAGIESMNIATMDCLWLFLDKIISQRQSQGTRMNQESSSHSGSSRSHCAVIFTLRQVNKESGEYIKTRLHMVDLAGAERPVKNGEERQSVAEALIHYYYTDKTKSSKKRSGNIVASQAAVINYELAELGKEVTRATDIHRKRKPYKPPLQVCTAAIQYLAGRFNGSFKIGMMICLSQAPNCGWETWFSLQYGIDLSKLYTPAKLNTKPSSSIGSLDTIMKDASSHLQDAKVALKNTPKVNAPASKYYPRRYKKVLELQREVKALEHLENILKGKNGALGTDFE